MDMMMDENMGSGDEGPIVDPVRPASTALLFIADPDSNLGLTGSAVNTIADAIAAATTATFGGAKASRQLAVLNGYNVLRGSCEQYLTPNDAAGKMDAYITDAEDGCVVGVFKPAANTDYLYRSRTVTSFEIKMVNDGGTPKLSALVYDTVGGTAEVKIACALSAWHTFAMRWTTDTLYLSVDGGAEQSMALGTAGGVRLLSHRMDLLGSLDVGGTFTGDFMELSVIDQTDRVQWLAFARHKYALS
jgi:hypothetical protein